ncbi:TPA: DUF4097 domain-containing protein [bacterium]|nr:DUF4097 domain-containing protein [bacterium]
MEKSLKRIGIFSAFLLFVGLVCVIVGVVLGSSQTIYFTTEGIKTYKLKELTNESFTPSKLNNIYVDSPSTKVRIFSSNSIKVETDYFKEITSNNVTIEDDELVINQKNKYLFKFDLFNPSNKENINLIFPKDYEIDTLNLDINVSSIYLDDVSVNHLIINGDVVNVNIEDAQIKNLEINHAVGSITLKNSVVNNIDIKGDVTNINCENITEIEDFLVNLKNGKTRLYKVAARNIDIKSVNGEISVSNSSIENLTEKINLSLTNGKVTLNAKAKDINVNTTNASITLNSVKSDILNVKTTNGVIKGSSFNVSESTTIKNINGSIDVRGRFSKLVNISTTNGSVLFRSTAGTAIKYNFDITTRNGKITVNESEIKNKRYTYQNDEYTNDLIISTINGNINVTARGNE